MFLLYGNLKIGNASTLGHKRAAPAETRAEGNGRTERIKEERRIALSDAAVTVYWLNCARAAKASASYQRVRSIWQQLRELDEVRLELRKFAPDPEEWDVAVQEHDKKRKLFKAGKIHSFESRFPGDRNRETPEGEGQYQELIGKAINLPSGVNEQLHRYIFRPRVDYIRLPGSLTILENIWGAGMVPDHSDRWFETTIGGRLISEADAALALVRLDLTQELNKVDRCKTCKDCWIVVAKRNYEYCSEKCRVAYYATDADYHKRKANNQKEYRKRVRAMHARQDATRKK